MPEFWVPGTIKKNIPPGANDPTIIPWGFIVHVRDGEGPSLFDYFDGDSGGIESHGYTRYDGTSEQYRALNREADANWHANSFGSPRKGFISWEFEGLENGRYTNAQMREMRRVWNWCANEYDWPYRKCPGEFAQGFGWHTMWGAPSEWTPVAKSCPGHFRKMQLQEEKPWEKGVIELASPKEVWNFRIPETNSDETRLAQIMLSHASFRAQRARELSAATLDAVNKLANVVQTNHDLLIRVLTEARDDQVVKSAPERVEVRKGLAEIKELVSGQLSLELAADEVVNELGARLTE